MSTKYEEMLSSDAFNALTDEQKKAYIDLAQSLNGKSMSESMLIIMSFMKNMPKGRPLSKEEQNTMMDTILKSLPAEDATKFQNIMKVVNKQ